jgi:hypothetical protein
LVALANPPSAGGEDVADAAAVERGDPACLGGRAATDDGADDDVPVGDVEPVAVLGDVGRSRRW